MASCEGNADATGPMITLQEAARVLGMNPGTLRVQIHNGKLKARKIGPIWTISRKELNRYQRESRRGCS